MNETKVTQKYLESARERIESAQVFQNAGQYNDPMTRVDYAFFDAATAALLHKDITAKTHHGLRILFEKHFIETGQITMGVGRWLARAQRAREEADYEIYKKFNKEEVGAGIQAAKEFVGEIEKIIKSS